MGKILLTGHKGFLGSLILSQGHFHQREIVVTELDLTEKKKVEELFERYAFQLEGVVHLAASSRPQYCQSHPEESLLINVKASTHLAQLCQKYNLKLLFTSSEQVFSGQRNIPLTENVLPDPINLYGEQKFLAEKKMRQNHPGLIVARMALMFGPNLNSGPVNFLAQWVRDLTDHRPLRAFVDEWRRPISGVQAIRLLEKAYDFPGETFHLSGKDYVSRFELAQTLGKLLKTPESLIEGVKQKELAEAMGLNHARPEYLNLENQKIISLLEYPLLELSEDLDFSLRDVFNRHREKINRPPIIS